MSKKVRKEPHPANLQALFSLGKRIISAEGNHWARGKGMDCPKCKTVNPDNATFCKKCGTLMYGYVPLDSPALASAKQQIIKEIKRRKASDPVLSDLWAFAPTILVVVSLVVSIVMAFISFSTFNIAFMISGSSIAQTQMFSLTAIETAWSIVNAVILGLLAYKLVSRENSHYLRENRLKQAVLGFIDRAAGSPERKTQLATYIATISMPYGAEPRRREPKLWAMLFIVPTVASGIFGLATFDYLYSPSLQDFATVALILIVALLLLIGGLIALVLEFYMFHFLGKTLREHEFRWGVFTTNVGMVLSRLGYPIWAPASETRIHMRSTAIYIVVTILTLGLFLLYWWYRLVKDPNEHFAQQHEFEDSLLRLLS